MQAPSKSDNPPMNRTETLKRMVEVNGLTWTFLVVVYAGCRTINKDLRLPFLDRLIRASRIVMVFQVWVPVNSGAHLGFLGMGRRRRREVD